MKITLDRINNDYLFEAKGKTGRPVYVDNTSQEGANGTSPMELLLMGVGGCSAIDIISILKKQRQEIKGYHIEVEGQRKKVKDANIFESINVIIYLEGAIDPEKAKRAAQLSFDKYCSVSLTLEPTVSITFEINLNGEKVV